MSFLGTEPDKLQMSIPDHTSINLDTFLDESDFFFNLDSNKNGNQQYTPTGFE